MKQFLTQKQRTFLETRELLFRVGNCFISNSTFMQLSILGLSMGLKLSYQTHKRAAGKQNKNIILTFKYFFE